MASPTQWTWVWVNSGSWWWTGRPGMLWFMGSQRVGHLSNWSELNSRIWSLSWSLSGKESTCQCRRCEFHPWIWRKWQPIPVFLPGKSYGQRSLEGYSPWGCKRVGHNLVTKQQQLLQIYTRYTSMHKEHISIKEDHNKISNNKIQTTFLVML